ncbi:MAG: YlmC/YmxH family sporulation protein [Ruminococcus sp.]|nr:YlmC/YmxH family sporulation protein [Ruminococcus sp.]MDE6539877.1 YlmC/YmxH family sporulation protein [Ruminococcus sp.]
MICRLEDLRKKEVIDILTGERLGYIDDAEMNIEKSAVQSFVIYGRERLFGILGREDDVVIPCSEIKVVGNDVVLIKHAEATNITKTINKNSGTL